MNKIFSLLLTLFSLQLRAQHLAVRELTCEYHTSPIGIEEPHPRLSWLLKSDQNNVKQTAYRIIVSGVLAQLDKNIGNIWDSKKVKRNNIFYEN